MDLNWRSQRQIIIFTTYFLIVAIPVAIFAFFMLHKSPTCFDKIQNADEEGIDCNGSCQLKCSGTYRDIKVNFARGMKVSDDVYNVFALVENYNTNVRFPNLPYIIKFYSTEGKLLGSASGSLAVLPQSKAAIYLPNLKLTQAPKTIDLSFSEYKAFTMYDTESIPKNVSVDNWQAQRGANNSLQVVGELKNPNNREVKNVSVYAMLFDDTDTVYAVSRTKVYSVIGREKVAVAFTWGDVSTPKNVEFVVVFDE